MNPHECISETFSTKERRDSMPRLLRRGTRDDLGKVFKTLGYRDGVEVGTRKGIFAEILCRAHPDMHLRCVDPWMGYNSVSQKRQNLIYPEAVKRLSKYNATIIRKTSMDAVADFEDRSLDFIYIDGNHKFDFVMLDLIHWVPKIRKGGIVSLHDYRPGHWAGVVEAVDAYTRCHDIRPWYVTREGEPTALWVQG